MEIEMGKQTKKFKTEVQHLLDLMIHSLYSNKDIYQRELIANAADAIDKARFESLRNQAIDSSDFKIRLIPNKENGTITISDNGIGMTHDEVVENIGTIARSGTKAFMQALEEKKENSDNDLPELIGQFGVGFYSSFMIADKVEVITKKAGSEEPAVKWHSTGIESYTIEETDKETQGTDVILHLKEDAKEYLEEFKIKSIVKKFSDFIEYPIVMKVTKTETDPDDEEKTIETEEDEILNSQKAIWLRTPSEVTEDEHKNFFEHLAPMCGDPLKTIHYSAEGTTEFRALLYLPSNPPFDLFMPENSKNGLHLYVKRIFITSECKDLLPEYLRFVKGVVDASDLPLNVSREILQESKQLKQIGTNLTKKVLSELKKIKEKDFDTYLKFWEAFGKVLKEGMHSDFANKDRIKELLVFETMNSEPGKLTSLKEYVSAMPENQKDIYYIIGENRKQLENSPHLEFFKKAGYDVIFMTDPIDEWVVQSLTDYNEKKVKSVIKGDIELDESEQEEIEKKTEEATKEYKDLLGYLKETLGDKVKEVRFSKRLTESACCLVSDEYDPDAYMQRIMKAMNQEIPHIKRILEVNPSHELVKCFNNIYEKDSSSENLKKFAHLLYDQALLTEGSPIENPIEFTKTVTELMVIGMKNETK
jgi:molecular chaperone HtpG